MPRSPTTAARRGAISPSASGFDLDPAPMSSPGAPFLFMMRDPDGNHIAVVEVPAS
jgi:predicted enzyme related to lactoylglutathione lyase